MGDRSGSREPKGSSLKKSKSNPGAAAAKKKKAPKLVPTSLQSQMPPVPRSGAYFDCGSAMLSRQFDRDRDRVLSRACDDGAAGIIAWFSDIEKQSALYDLCKANSGYVYYVCGVHPDNIDRTNKKSHEGWLEKVEEFGRKPECVGVLTGLNLSREMGTHFPQEAMLKSSCAVADKLGLPLIVHCTDCASLERAVEILREEEWALPGDEEADGAADSPANDRRVIIHDAVTACGGDVSKLQIAIDAGFNFIVSAVGLTDDVGSVVRAKAEECVRAIPDSRLLSATDSPWRTPQNIPDAYLRTLRNEPCNIAFVNNAIASTMGRDPVELGVILKSNALRSFGLEFANMDEAPIGAAVQAIECLSLSNVVEPVAVARAELPIVASPVEAKPESVASLKPPASEGGFYCCQKCRVRLFSQSHISTHTSVDSTRTVFRVGQEEGVCRSVLFVPTIDADPIKVQSLPFGVSVGQGKSMTVECSHCGVKLGKFCTGESVCSCGANVNGPAIRILAAKVDYVDTSIAQEELLLRAKIEAEQLGQQAILDEEAEEERRREEANKKGPKKGKKIVSQNKGNFSSFRNKSFIPNASRSAKAAATAAAAGDGSDSEENNSEDEDDAPLPQMPLPSKRGGGGNKQQKGGKGGRAVAFAAMVESSSDDDDS